ncbi:AraC family transcriptional regulator [Amycolatopsis orientalis]|uniref:AraC family transcriptional regulator n=1 Tax=Amycolatopsis orientalis TaxID=31958 RepID=UPI0003A60E15|nr:AraC family transcriptional regulator [Amycolatopsis orientalis]
MEAGAWWDFRRNPVAVRIMTEVAAEHGLAVSEALAGTRLAASDLDDPGVEIDARQELTVVRNLVAALGDRPGLAAEIGSRFALGNYGLLGFAVLSSPTLRAALVVGLRYLTLSYAFIRVSLEESGEQARIVLDDREIPPDVRRFLLERDIAALTGFVPSLLGPRLERYAADARVELSLETAEALGEIAPLAAVSFGHQRSALVFPRALLEERLPQADEHTARICEEQCADLLRRRTDHRGLAGQIRSRLLRDPGELPSMAQVATELHIDPRTLRRRLAAEQTSFRSLVDEVRATMSQALLDQVGLTVEEVARRLGYSETASFTHAFTRWYGIPPSRYRDGRAPARD